MLRILLAYLCFAVILVLAQDQQKNTNNVIFNDMLAYLSAHPLSDKSADPVKVLQDAYNQVKANAVTNSAPADSPMALVAGVPASVAAAAAIPYSSPADTKPAEVKPAAPVTDTKAAVDTKAAADTKTAPADLKPVDVKPATTEPTLDTQSNQALASAVAPTDAAPADKVPVAVAIPADASTNAVIDTPVVPDAPVTKTEVDKGIVIAADPILQNKNVPASEAALSAVTTLVPTGTTSVSAHVTTSAVTTASMSITRSNVSSATSVRTSPSATTVIPPISAASSLFDDHDGLISVVSILTLVSMIYHL